MRLTRLSLTINGIERFVVCDPEKDSLAEVLRRMGLTGREGWMRHWRVRRLLRNSRRESGAFLYKEDEDGCRI